MKGKSREKDWLKELISDADVGRDYFVEVPRDGILRTWERLMEKPHPDDGEDENELAALVP